MVGGREVLINTYKGKRNNKYPKYGEGKNSGQPFTNRLKNHALTTFPIQKTHKKKAP